MARPSSSRRMAGTGSENEAYRPLRGVVGEEEGVRSLVGAGGRTSRPSCVEVSPGSGGGLRSSINLQGGHNIMTRVVPLILTPGGPP